MMEYLTGMPHQVMKRCLSLLLGLQGDVAIEGFRLGHDSYPPSSGGEARGDEVMILYRTEHSSYTQFMMRLLLSRFLGTEKCLNHTGEMKRLNGDGEDLCIYVVVQRSPRVTPV